MKKMLVVLVFALALPVQASDEGKEQAVQHMKIADITSMQDAKQVFNKITAEFKNSQQLSALDLHAMHITTYTLEKSIAYFANNLIGEQQKLAQQLAVVVEDIHINSENNRQDKTQEYLNNYMVLADRFSATL